MNDNDIETYFLWLTEAEQSDLFNYEDRSVVSNLICENVMEQHNSLASDYDYVEKPLSEYSSNESMHVQSMNPEPTNVATTYNYNQDIIPANLFYNASGINHPYQTINQNSTEFNPIYYENPSKDVESIHPFSVQSPMVDPSIVPPTMNYIASNATPVVEYNNVSSLPSEMEHLPSNTMSDYTDVREMQGPGVNVESDTPLEQLHIASALLDVPLEQLNNDAVSVQPELSAESIDLNRVSQDVSMISADTRVHFSHESIDTIDSCSNIPSSLEPIADSSEYHDDTSRSGVDENPQLSMNYEVEDQRVPENVDISDCPYSESESLSTTCVTNEITMAESQASNTNEVISAVEEEKTCVNNEEKEPSVGREPEEENCEVTNQVNGTIYEAENDIPVVQMCIRNGCVNPAVNNPEWEQEFCSNDCVVMHCRNVFDTWVEGNAVMSR